MRSLSVVVSYLMVLALPAIVGCTATSGRSFLPPVPGYNEKQKQLMVFDGELLEISGMYFLPDGRIAMNNDEEGKIFLVNMQTGAFESIEFEGKGDFEDLVLFGDSYYILESNGKIYKVGAQPPHTKSHVKFEGGKKIEFESMYVDAAAKKLVIITKDHRNSGKEILAYSYDPATNTFSTEPYYRISMATIFSRIQDNAITCKPSAAAVHPIEHKLYIVASIGKALLKCSMQGKVEQVYQLNPTQFPQPEGITFAPNGDMYISNEGVQGKATVLKFPYVHR
ncbi:MAG TPA: hypothetical protein VM012_14425 [Flavitalea sp.]|nr:hypothetical protein [Flavitalea sp.]